MLQIGNLRITGEGKWPRSRKAMKADLRGFARSLGLDLKFIARKTGSVSACRVATAQAVVCERTGKTLWPMSHVIFTALHEIAHWIQYNEGMFRDYFGGPYYDRWHGPKAKDLTRLALRAERHADLLARKLAMELYGAYLVGGSIYDDTTAAKTFLKEHYGAHYGSKR